MNKELILGIISLGLTVTGWLFDHGEDIEWVSRFMTPRYYSTLAAYDELIRTKQPLIVGAPGFADLASLIKEDLTGDGNLELAEILVTDTAVSALSSDKGVEMSPTVSISLTLRDGRKIQAASYQDLRPRIKEKYLDAGIFFWGATVFWLGVFGSIATLYLVVHTKEE